MIGILRVSTTTDPAATAIARGYVAASGIDVHRIPRSASVHVGEEGTEKDRAGIRSQIGPRHDVRLRVERTVHN